MILLKNLLKEEHQFRSREISSKSFLQLVNSDDFKAAKEKYDTDYRIYRGYKSQYSDSGRYYVDPLLGTERKSKSTTNFYMALQGSLPSWRKYPKRSKSIICATTRNTAKIYGPPHVIFLQKNALIGICPKSDFWYSFTEVSRRFKMGDMTDFNTYFFKLFNEMFDMELADKSSALTEKGYKDFIQIINERTTKDGIVGFLDYKTPDKNPANVWHPYIFLLKDLSMYWRGDWEKYFDDLLNPETNGFKLQTIENFDIKGEDREVWTDSPALMARSAYDDVETTD